MSQFQGYFIFDTETNIDSWISDIETRLKLSSGTYTSKIPNLRAADLRFSVSVDTNLPSDLDPRFNTITGAETTLRSAQYLQNQEFIAGELEPTNRASLDHWFVSRDVDTSPAGAVQKTTWNDRSGNGYSVTQAIAVNRPTMLLNQIEGAATLQASGNQVMTGTGFNALTSTSDYTVGICFKIDDTSTFQEWYALYEAVGGLTGIIIRYDGRVTAPAGEEKRLTLTSRNPYGGTLDRLIGTTQINDNNVHTVFFRRNTGTGFYELFLDGVSDGTLAITNTTTYNSSLNDLAIFANRELTREMDGQIREIMFYREALSDAEIINTEHSRLNLQYNLDGSTTSLPTIIFPESDRTIRSGIFVSNSDINPSTGLIEKHSNTGTVSHKIINPDGDEKIQSDLVQNIRTESTNYTVVDTDDIIFIDTTSAGLTITLLDASLSTQKERTIKNLNGTNSFTVDTTGGQFIDGQLTAVVPGGAAPFSSITIVPNGSNWLII